MTQEDKNLLLKDLSSRLPYGVILNCCNLVGEKLYTIDSNGLINNDYDLEEVKPYLFPMSSMTEEEEEEYRNIDNRSYSCPIDYAHIPSSDRIDWLNKKMFDYRGLIEKGLAIAVTEDNNPYKD